VTGVGEQPDGVADEARNGFDDDKEQVERDGDDIDGRQFLYRVRVVMVVQPVVVFVFMFVVVIMVLLETVFMVVVVFHNFDGFMF
jgi:uncharacterized membrane protein